MDAVHDSELRNKETSDTDPIRDPLIPFGTLGPPSADVWGPDVLGAGFEARSLPLLNDNEGEVTATLVQHLSKQDPGALKDTPEPHFTILYIHGWSDYFFQRELARHCSRAGAKFYALDLRKYGRSYRLHQTFGYMDRLSVYDEDIHAALSLIPPEEHENLVLMGHSTGGLIAALWAHRHPGALVGLMLNSPWLEIQKAASLRGMAQPIFDILARRAPLTEVPTPESLLYSRTIAGWEETDGPLPDHLQDWPDDPAVTGWDIFPEWKGPDIGVVRIGWLNAVMEGHAQVAAGLDIDCPVFTICSTSSSNGKWHPKVRRQDTVLDADLIAERALTLGNNVTLIRLPGTHDLTLSDPDVRLDFYESFHRWTRAFIGDGNSGPGVPAPVELCP